MSGAGALVQPVPSPQAAGPTAGSGSVSGPSARLLTSPCPCSEDPAAAAAGTPCNPSRPTRRLCWRTGPSAQGARPSQRQRAASLFRALLDSHGEMLGHLHESLTVVVSPELLHTHPSTRFLGCAPGSLGTGNTCSASDHTERAESDEHPAARASNPLLPVREGDAGLLHPGCTGRTPGLGAHPFPEPCSP